MNRLRKSKGQDLWPTAAEMNKERPVVTKMEIDASYGTKMIELWVRHKTKYMGITGVIHGTLTDIWFLAIDGRFIENCPYPIFKVKR
jgi:hypothetical protein